MKNEPEPIRRRCIVNVATGHYVVGQNRLIGSPHIHAETMVWADELPPGAPTHEEKPYAFKAWALKAAADAGYTTLLWCDACIRPVKSLDSLWKRIERDGYWIPDNGKMLNWPWTAESAYADLEVTEDENKLIPHVTATTFAVDVTTKTGRKIFDEFFRLAQTNAFCGAWDNEGGRVHPNPGVQGHRHDQTALSVIAYRLGCELTRWPEQFAYAGQETSKTILVADGDY